MLAKLLPFSNAIQKFSPFKFLYAVHQNAEKSYQDIIKFHGFKLSDGIVKDYIEMCERANLDDGSEYSSEEPRKRSRKNKKKREPVEGRARKKSSKKRYDEDDDQYYCSHHGKNPSHATKDCYTLKNLEKKKSKKGGKREIMVLESKLARRKERLIDKDQNLKKQKQISEKLYKKYKALKLKLEEKGEISSSDDEEDKKPAARVEDPIPRVSKTVVDLFNTSSDDDDENSSKESGEETTDSDSD